MPWPWSVMAISITFSFICATSMITALFSGENFAAFSKTLKIACSINAACTNKLKDS